MRLRIGSLDSDEDVRRAILDVETVVQQHGLMLEALLNSADGDVWIPVRNSDGTYGVRRLVAGVGVTFVDDPVTGTITATSP